MKLNGVEVLNNPSPNGEYHKVRKYCEKLAHAYRTTEKLSEKSLIAGELRKYGFLNINNSTGQWVIVV